MTPGFPGDKGARYTETSVKPFFSITRLLPMVTVRVLQTRVRDHRILCPFYLAPAPLSSWRRRAKFIMPSRMESSRESMRPAP